MIKFIFSHVNSWCLMRVDSGDLKVSHFDGPYIVRKLFEMKVKRLWCAPTLSIQLPLPTTFKG